MYLINFNLVLVVLITNAVQFSVATFNFGNIIIVEDAKGLSFCPLLCLQIFLFGEFVTNLELSI
jgi:hypothetical protein